MRVLTTIATIAGLGILGNIVWQAEGPQLLEKLHLEHLIPATTERTMDVDTLVEMCQDDAFKNQLDWKVDAKLDRPAFATFGSVSGSAFVGGDATEAETRSAILDWQQRVDSATMSSPSATTSPNKRHASIRPSQSRSNASKYSVNNSQDDYKRIPRMQRHSLTNLQRFGNLNPFGKRSLYNQTRFGQQQRELDRLRARRDTHLNGKVVNRD